jgi:hypothetical protein
MFQKLLLTLAAAASAYAATPVGSGTWTKVSPGFNVQQCAGGVVSGNVFTIPTSPNGSTSGSGCSNGHLRAERRYTNDYTSGIHQFGGSFTITSQTGNRIAIKQTFNGDSGPYFIMGVKDGGTLYSVEGGATIATGVAHVGTKVVINTVHDANAGRFSVYVNGVQKYTDNDAPGGGFYDKLGAYTTDSGTGALTIRWDDVTFWTQ